MQKTEIQLIASDLDAIKKLMILSLLQKGFKQKSLALTLGVSEATLSEMFPKGSLKQARDLSDE
jgi:predicted transcriptional regulator